MYWYQKKNLLIVTEPLLAVKSISFNKLPEDLKAASQDKVGKQPSNTKSDSVKRLRSNGLTYEINPNLCYILNCVEDEHIPCFGQVKHILLLGQWYLFMKIYFPKKYIEEAHAYEVEYQAPWCVVLPNEVLDCHKHRLYRKKL